MTYDRSVFLDTAWFVRIGVLSLTLQQAAALTVIIGTLFILHAMLEVSVLSVPNSIRTVFLHEVAICEC